jgi:Tfp pilus assembly protein PilV
MSRSTTRAAVFLALALLSLAGTPRARAGELATWNQEKVATIAEEISQTAQALRDTLRRQPPPTLGQSGRHAFWSLREEMQVLVSSCAPSGRRAASLSQSPPWAGSTRPRTPSAGFAPSTKPSRPSSR